MAAIEVSLPSILQPMAGQRSRVTVEAETFRGAVDALLAAHPLLAPHLFDDIGELREHVNIFWNGDNGRWLESWDVPARDGDTVTILQAVSGG